MEFYRSKNQLAHKDAVSMIGAEDYVNLAGSATDHIYMVNPLGKIEKHDLNWNSEISSLVGDGYNINSIEVKKLLKVIGKASPP